MALSGSFLKYPVTTFGLYCEWSATQSAIGNYSDVKLDVYLSYATISVSAKENNNVSIDGTAKTYNTPAISDYSSGWKKKLLTSHTVRVYHDSGGKKTCDLSASWYFGGTYHGVSVGTITATDRITLDTIDRTTPSVLISASDITPTSVNISASASVTCDVWQYSIDNGANWVQFSTSSGTSAAVTVTGLSPNTTYQVKVRARKKSNQIYGTSGATAIKTLGPAMLNSVTALTADNDPASLAFNWTTYSKDYTYALVVKNGAQVITTISIPAQTTSGTANKTITLTSAQRTAILSGMASLKSFSGTFELKTLSGSTQIGNVSSKVATVQTTAANSSPTFSDPDGFTYYDASPDVAAITGNNQIMVQDYSALVAIAYAAVAKNGASIVSYEATINDTVIKSGTNLLIGTISKSGTLVLTVRAIDSRGYSVSKSKNITVVAYKPIDISDIQMRRVNEVEAMTQVNLSTNISKILVSSVNKNGFVAMKYRHKKTSESSYSAYTSIPAEQLTIAESQISFQTDEFISLDPDYSYNIQFYIEDKLSTDTDTVTLPQGTPLISRRRKRVGINNRNPQSALDIIGEMIQNGVFILGYIGTISGSFNDYKSGGIFYYSGSGASNAPAGGAGFLEVLSNGSDAIHRFTATSSGCAVYIRSYIKSSSTWTTWTAK